MSSPSLEQLITSHRTTLLQLYTSLSPQPQPLVNSHFDALQQLLDAQIAQQVQSTTDELARVEQVLSERWAKVTDWRAALGEPVGAVKTKADGPLLTLVDEVDQVIEGMRSRMQQRGEAIVELQRRLSAFIEVVGREWLAVELEDWEKGWEGLDLRLERMSSLERECLRCETEIAHRRDLLALHLNEIFALRSELGIHQTTGTNTSPSSSSTGPRASLTGEIPLADPLDEAILSHLGVGEEREKKEMLATSENLARVEAKRKWLEEEKATRNATIQATYDKLYPLWTMLGVSELEMEQFVNCWMGSTMDVVNAYQSELTRMLTLKRSNLSAFITRERTLLTCLWDTLYLSPTARLSSFPPYSINVDPILVYNAVTGVEDEQVNENVSEELLVAHERERERVEGEVEEMRPVLERLGRYFGVVEEMRELEASAADPSRLLGKSTRGDPGRLLREEKARKRVMKEKPKLEAELRQLIPQWEAANHRPFLVNGVRFLDDLDAKIEEEMREKENKKRSKLVPTSSGSSSSSTRPLRAQQTGTSSSSTLPLKRQMTGRSTTSNTSSGAPPPKRQTATHTGASSMSGGGGLNRQRSASVLGERNRRPVDEQPAGKLVAQNTGRSVLSSSSSTTNSGMRIPAGWGSHAIVDTSAHAPPPAPSGSTYKQGAIVRPQMTGFRPRPSTAGR